MNHSRGAKHGRSQEQYEHFNANESTRHVRKKHFPSMTDRWHGVQSKRILKSPSDGPKNVANIWTRSCQLISRTQPQGMSVRDLRTILLSASMVKDRSLGPMKKRAEYQQAANKVLVLRRQVEKPNPKIRKHLRFRQRPIEERERLEQQWKRWEWFSWSQYSSSSSTQWTPQK